jgi:hypothetical protein
MRRKITKKKLKITELQNECLGYIINYLNTAKDVFSMMMSCHKLYDLFFYNNLNYVTCKNIVFNQNKTPTNPVKYVSNICLLKHQNINKNLLQYYSLLKKIIIDYNNLIEDKHFKYFEGIHTLSMKGCSQITDEGFKYLTMTKNLNMSYCKQSTISDNAFKWLNNIEFLDISCCDQSTITSEIFDQINKKIKILIMVGCNQSQMHPDGLKPLSFLEELYISESFNDKDIVQVGGGFFKNLKILFMSFTKFNYNSFIGLNKLITLDITKNVEQKLILNDHMLKDLISLECLKMNGVYDNRITDEFFSYLPNLNCLFMDDCKQITITNKAFSYLSNLRGLSMIGCNQKTITKDVFDYWKNLVFLHLSTGNLSLFKLENFEKLTSIKELFIKISQPLKIDEQLYKFFKTIKKFNISF